MSTNTMEAQLMNQYLRDRFEARDATGIVTAQRDDGRLPLMCESVIDGHT